MAITERDYYELLGVSRSAEDAEIKRAFRRLARGDRNILHARLAPPALR